MVRDEKHALRVFVAVCRPPCTLLHFVIVIVQPLAVLHSPLTHNP